MKSNNIKKIMLSILFYTLFLSVPLIIYYSAEYLPNKYRKEFIEELKNNEIKEAYFYNYTYFDTTQLPKNEKNIKTLKLLRKMKPSDDGELCRNCNIFRVLNRKKIENPSEIKGLLPYLNNLETASPKEGVHDNLLLKIIFQNNKVVWIEFGLGGRNPRSGTFFMINFDLKLKDEIEYKAEKYLFFKQESYGEFIAPKLEKFFDEFKLSEWRKENREKLKKMETNNYINHIPPK